eukprot:gene6741-7835_t
MTVVESFREYVRPVHHPILSAFCTQLTGIEQATVEKSSDFATVYKNHFQWLVTQGFLRENGAPTDLTFAFVTCGDWDLKTCLPNQLRSIEKPFNAPTYFQSWINIKKSFETFYKPQRCRGMTDMLAKLHIPLQGRHHSGLDDCLNISSVAIKMLKDGCNFTYTTVAGGKPIRK